MAGKTAEYLVNRIRSRVGMYDRTKLRDGFSKDAGMADRDILSFLNDAINELLGTGYHKCRFSVPVVADQAEYPLDEGIGQVLVATYAGVVLTKTRLTTLYRNNQGPIDATGTPTHWYNDIPDVFGLNPIPDTSDTTSNSLEMIAESLAQELTTESDIPDRLPAVFHPRLVDGPAYKILLSFGPTDEFTVLKINEYKALWLKTVDDVAEMANNRQQDEVYQMAPDEYRTFYIYANANGV